MKNTKMMTLSLLAASMWLAVASPASAGIEYGLSQVSAGHFRVLAKSDQASSGLNAMVSAAQVSILLPLNVQPVAAPGALPAASEAAVQSGQAGLWELNSMNGSSAPGDAGQSEHPANRVMSVGQVNAGANIAFSYAGQELSLFDFYIEPSDCAMGEGLRLVAAADPIAASPNSVGTNVSNSWSTVMGEQYQANYAPDGALEVACQ